MKSNSSFLRLLHHLSPTAPPPPTAHFIRPSNLIPVSFPTVWHKILKLSIVLHQVPAVRTLPIWQIVKIIKSLGLIFARKLIQVVSAYTFFMALKKCNSVSSFSFLPIGLCPRSALALDNVALAGALRSSPSSYATGSPSRHTTRGVMCWAGVRIKTLKPNRSGGKETRKMRVIWQLWNVPWEIKSLMRYRKWNNKTGGDHGLRTEAMAWQDKTDIG